MASKTDICNLALMRIGVSQLLVNVDTDTTREALSAVAIFDRERDFVLRDSSWGRARAYVTLNTATNFANPANLDWTYAYRYPSDALFIRRILTTGGRQEVNPPPFTIGRDPAFAAAAWSGVTVYVIGNLVLQASVVYECILGNTNQQPPNGTYWRVVPNAQLVLTDTAAASVEYTVQVTDATQFDSEFVSMLAWRLGAALVMSLSRVPEIAKTCLEMYAAERAAAEERSRDEAQKDRPVDIVDAASQEITHMALLRLGVMDDEGDTDARLAKIAYLRERDFVLRDFPWSWATAYADAVLFAGDQNSPVLKDWTYAYRYPADALFIRRAVNALDKFGFRRPRYFQSGADADWPIPFRISSAALGTITIAYGTVPANNDTLTINARVYTWKTVLTGAVNEILIGPDSGACARNLAECINAGPNIGVDYGAGTTASADVRAMLSGTTLTTGNFVAGSVVTITGLSGVSVNWSKVSANTTLSPAASLLAARFVFSNEPNITVEYTRQLATASEFDNYDRLFSSMLAWRLAATLALTRVKDPKVARERRLEAMQAYLMEKSQAEARALSEGQAEQPNEAEWIRGR